MRTRPLAVLLLLAPISGCATVESEDPPTALDAQRETAAIRAVLDAQQDAWNRGDVDGYMAAGYWQSPCLVFLSGGSITRGYEPVLARYKANYQGQGAEMGQLDFRETEVELLSPDIALARGRWDLAMKTSKPVGGRYSLVLRKLDVGWRIVQDHSSSDSPAN
ncbi:MAG: DUF4440 domain-containing protein [Planctomycetota bacterium]|nr:MAG: DUF4440 domain-containing protein [Planctomycetota bacterium]